MIPLLNATVLIDVPTAMFAGTIIPLIMIRLLRLQPEVEAPRAVGLGAAWGLWYSLAVSYMYFKYPDWMLGYLADARTLPLVPIWIVFVLACLFAGAAGAAIGTFFVQRNQVLLAALCVLGSAATYFAIFIPHFHGYTHIGTFEEYRAGVAMASPGPPDAQFGMTMGGVLTAIPSIAMIVVIIRRSMKS